MVSRKHRMRPGTSLRDVTHRTFETLQKLGGDAVLRDHQGLFLMRPSSGEHSGVVCGIQCGMFAANARCGKSTPGGSSLCPLTTPARATPSRSLVLDWLLQTDHHLVLPLILSHLVCPTSIQLREGRDLTCRSHWLFRAQTRVDL